MRRVVVGTLFLSANCIVDGAYFDTIFPTNITETLTYVLKQFCVNNVRTNATKGSPFDKAGSYESGENVYFDPQIQTESNKAHWSEKSSVITYPRPNDRNPQVTDKRVSR